jgi:hypothetical protein
VHFAAGADAAELAGGIPRGGRDCYTFSARAGQTLSVTQPHPVEGNIALQVYRPHWRLAHDANGLRVTGDPLPGAAEGQDASRWSGRLPAGGEYLLVLGTTRGSGEYRVRLRIR